MFDMFAEDQRHNAIIISYEFDWSHSANTSVRDMRFRLASLSSSVSETVVFAVRINLLMSVSLNKRFTSFSSSRSKFFRIWSASISRRFWCCRTRAAVTPRCNWLLVALVLPSFASLVFLFSVELGRAKFKVFWAQFLKVIFHVKLFGMQLLDFCLHPEIQRSWKAQKEMFFAQIWQKHEGLRCYRYFKDFQSKCSWVSLTSRSSTVCGPVPTWSQRHLTPSSHLDLEHRQDHLALGEMRWCRLHRAWWVR